MEKVEPVLLSSVNYDSNINDPTAYPTKVPSVNIVFEETYNPTMDPTSYSTVMPTVSSSFASTIVPTYEYENTSIHKPSFSPTSTPTFSPSNLPIDRPTNLPTIVSSQEPSSSISDLPSSQPSYAPTYFPTTYSTSVPTSSIPTIVNNVTTFSFRTSIIISAFLSKSGSIYCAAYSYGETPASVDDIVDKSFLSQFTSSPVNITITDLTAVTTYDVYCATKSDSGDEMSLSDALLNKHTVTTACCKLITVSILDSYVYQNNELVDTISVE
eukprot:gene14339-19231_t